MQIMRAQPLLKLQTGHAGSYRHTRTLPGPHRLDSGRPGCIFAGRKTSETEKRVRQALMGGSPFGSGPGR
eukprot:scaffold590519_cov45-Prasinocladus_malaysianus.AAC.1